MSAQKDDYFTPPNGVPKMRVFESTEEHVDSMVTAAKNESDDPMEGLAKLILAAMHTGGGDGGGDGGDDEDEYEDAVNHEDKTLREIKKHKWLAALMSLFLGSGGMIGSYYALKARAENNTTEVQSIKEAAKVTADRIEHNEDQIRMIKVDVSDINTSVGVMKEQNTVIVHGIQELKQENVNRLEKENAKLEREIRRLERGNH